MPSARRPKPDLMPSLFDTPDDRARKEAMRPGSNPRTPVIGAARIQVRDYQRDIVDEALRLHLEDKFRSVLIVAATGLGKTVIAGHLARRWREVAPTLGRSPRALFLAHREELLTQAEGSMRAMMPGAIVHIDQAEKFAQQTADVVCGSVQTLCGEHRLERFPPDHFGIIFVDEAHHWVKVNRTYQVIMNRFASAFVPGLTATPNRADERALGQSFEAALASVYNLEWGMANGWLVRVVAESLTISGLDFRYMENEPGKDWKDGAGSKLADLMKTEGPLHGIVGATIKMANMRNAWHTEGTRPTLVFGASVEHAALMAEIFNRRHDEHGTGRAAVVYSQAKGMPAMRKEERRAILDAYKNGYYSYLCNYGVLTEGTDLPRTRIVVPARPTKSRPLFEQMIGRGTRPWPEIVNDLNAEPDPAKRCEIIRNSQKPTLMVLDLIGISGVHKLCSSVDVLAGWEDSEEVIATAKERIKKKGGRADINEELRLARIEQLRREAAQRRVVADVEFTRRTVNLFDPFDVSTGREPGWFKGKRITGNQKACLQKAGYTEDELEDVSFFKASKLIEELIRRRKENLCTYSQAKLLQKYGHEPKDITFDQARAILDDLAKRGWPKPKGDEQ